MDSCWLRKREAAERDAGKYARERYKNSSDGRKDTSKDMRLADIKPNITNEFDLRARRFGSSKHYARERSFD